MWPIVDEAQLGLQFGLQLLPGFCRDERIHITHHGEEVSILHAQEIVPEEITYAQQPRKRVEHFGPFERSKFIWPIRLCEQLPDKLTEVQQSGLGVRRVGKQMGKVFDQNCCSAQFPLFVGSGDFSSVRIGDIERVVYAVADRVDRDARNVNATEGQCIGKLIKKPDGIRRLDVENRVPTRGVVVNLYINGIERHRRAADFT